MKFLRACLLYCIVFCSCFNPINNQNIDYDILDEKTIQKGDLDLLNNIKQGKKSVFFSLKKDCGPCEKTNNLFSDNSFKEKMLQHANVIIHYDSAYSILNKYISDSFKLQIINNSFSWLEISPSLEYNSFNEKNDLYAVNKQAFNKLLNFENVISFHLKNDLSISTNLSIFNQDNFNQEIDRKAFILNGSVEKRIFKKKNGSIGLTLMDFTKENYISGFVSNEFGYKNRQTNTNSRYLLIQFSWKPQQWGGK